MPGFYDDSDSDLDELRAEARHARQYNARLAAAPDCRDPDHPGCECCEGDEFDDSDE